jgi:hypothetical protein
VKRILYYYELGVIRKGALISNTSSVVEDVSEDIGTNLALHQYGSEIFFYAENAMISPFALFSIGMEGTGKNAVYTTDTIINSFDILAK